MDRRQQEAVSKKCLSEALSPRVKADAILCTDGSAAMAATAKEMGVHHEAMSRGLRDVVVRSGFRAVEVIRTDRLWLCSAPVDMRCGADWLLAYAMHISSAALALLVNEGFRVWCAARRPNVGRFDWPMTQQRDRHR